MLSVIGIAIVLVQQKSVLPNLGPYDRSVPTPESILGREFGSWHTTYLEQDKVIKAIVAKSPARIKEFVFGKSGEGRPLRIYAISSPENISKLDSLRSQISALANPQSGQKNTFAKDLPAIVWINECIHGNETASFESAMWLIYNLAASESTEVKRDLKNCIVIINPSYNPDGHERHVVWYNSVAKGDPDPNSFEHDWPASVDGRTNKYRFDMNRDRVVLSQPETQAEVKEFLKWNPQIYVDQHGQVGTYFFPPNPMSINANVDRARLNRWTDILGRATAKQFDAHGWPFSIRESFDLYYPGYLDSFTTLSGAIGMTHETDGGGVLSTKRDDGSLVTLQSGALKHLTSALAVIDAASDHRDELLRSFVDYKQSVVDAKLAGSFRTVFVVSEDPRPLNRLAQQLSRAGIQWSLTTDSVDLSDSWSFQTQSKEKVQIPAMSLVVDIGQPQGALAKSILEAQSDFEPEFTKNQLAKRARILAGERPSGDTFPEFYDWTGWSPIYGHNLLAWSSSLPPKGIGDTYDPLTGKAIRTMRSLCPYKFTESGGFTVNGINHLIADSTIGFAIEYKDEEDILNVIRLMQSGARVNFSPKPMSLAGQKFARGTFMFMNVGNSTETIQAVKALGARPIPTSFPDYGGFGPGSESVISLREPKIGLVCGDNQWGSVRYALDKLFKIEYTALPMSALSGDLKDYTALILPAGNFGDPSPKLKEWVRNGGSVVCLGWADWFTSTDKGFAKLDEKKPEKGRFGRVPGALFKAQLDPKSMLSFGYRANDVEPISIAVPVDGGTFFKTPESGAAITFSSKEGEKKLLTGWEWPDETEKALQGTAWLYEQPVGSGRAIFFAEDPTGRAMWPGLHKLLLNAIL